jgi:hypothetical protein
MKSRSSVTLVLVNAVLWSAALMGSAIVLSGTGYYEKVSYILITLWVSSSLALQASRESIQSEWRCIRRLFSSAPRTE